jgi:chaperonin GroES
MSLSVQPLGSRVLVRIEAEETVTKSGLYLTETAKEKPQRGIVVAVGDDSEVVKVAFGDRVLFARYTGTEISLDSVDHLIIEASDLLAVLRDEPLASSAA